MTAATTITIRKRGPLGNWTVRELPIVHVLKPVVGPIVVEVADRPGLYHAERQAERPQP